MLYFLTKVICCSVILALLNKNQFNILFNILTVISLIIFGLVCYIEGLEKFNNSEK